LEVDVFMSLTEFYSLGDSGFLVLSPGKVVHRSTSQTHAFNTPYQFSKLTPRMQAQQYIFGGTEHFSETPADADETLYDLKHGDIVLFATDGVWDNLSAQDTLAIATKVMQDAGYWSKPQGSSSSSNETIQDDARIRALPTIINDSNSESYLPGLLSKAVMREAKVTGLDRKRNGPFAKEVRQRYPSEGWVGGKPDDIAVVVCIAVQGEAEQATDGGSAGIKAKL
jgi:protein phosphatase PTC7